MPPPGTSDPRGRDASPRFDVMDINILSLASALATHASTRQQVLAENIANADTPGFQARDIADFSTFVDEGPAFNARVTRPGHMSFGSEMGGYEARAQTALAAETPNGNTVSLEDQMVRAASVRQEHELAVGVYSKTLDILHTSVKSR